MREIKLPEELKIGEFHGKVSWAVRSIWEEHVGWFRYESTTELYDVPPSSVWPDVVELIGGTGPIIERANTYAQLGRPLQALHLTDIVLAQSPGDGDALRVKKAALEALLAASGRENHSEVQWLEQEIDNRAPEEDA